MCFVTVQGGGRCKTVHMVKIAMSVGSGNCHLLKKRADNTKMHNLTSRDLHNEADFDVHFQELSSRTGRTPWKTSYRFTGSTLWPIYRFFAIAFKLRSYPITIDEGTTVVIISGMNFCGVKSCPLDTPRNTI